jgi:hypothetical protein
VVETLKASTCFTQVSLGGMEAASPIITEISLALQAFHNTGRILC